MSSSLGSWGRYPQFAQQGRASFWQNELPSNLRALRELYGSTLAYGQGRSYGDSCLAQSGHVMPMRGLDRFISFDVQTGVVRAEAGLTLDVLLQHGVPQGWFLPVTPGTRYVTLGGAVANDVHGKNHHVQGTFGCHVRAFGLLRSDQDEALHCSLSENTELFHASIGGLGLTGIISWVELQLRRIASSTIKVQRQRFGNLSDFFALSERYDQSHEYTVAWVDCLAQGATLGRGVFFAGQHATAGELVAHTNKQLRVPFTPPISAVNRLSLGVFNALYFQRHAGPPQHGSTPYAPFFYPLDGIQEWNRMYGPCGFQQYQCVVPRGEGPEAITALLNTIAVSGRGSFLSVLKLCGNIASPGLLSFPMPGVSLALDFAQHADLGEKLFPRLDAIVREAGGRLYPAKDAHMSAADFQIFYPAWQQLESLRDPALLSRFWQRTTQL